MRRRIFGDRSGCESAGAVELNFAAVRFEQADDQAQEGRFAAAARTDQGGRLAALESEIESDEARDRVAEDFC